MIEEGHELGFKLRVGRFCRLAGSEFQTSRPMKLKEHRPKDFKLLLGIFKSFLLEDPRVCDVWYLKLTQDGGDV